MGLGCCPGHRLKRMSVIPLKDSLNDDLARIVAWRPHMVLTLMEDRELSRAGIPTEALLKAFARDSIHWRHLPIENLEAPGEEFEAVWPSFGQTWTENCVKERDYSCIVTQVWAEPE